jgi:uncharacterized protein
MNFSKTLFIFILLSVFNCSKKKSSLEKKGNDLVNETSPYLLQHAYNPVNWKAWNSKTLELAKKENKLIIISVGYSACHWCHVMEEESFENDSIAKIMNDNFISIKVDREERPDVDKVYMNAVQLLTGSGGWPLNAIALPDGRPIFGGTYFTKDQWQKILIDISKLYKENPEKAIDFAEKLTAGIQESQLVTYNTKKPNFNSDEIVSSIKKWNEYLDLDFGGFKNVQKFPMPNSLDYLLRYSFQFDDKEMHQYVNNTLTKIAYGGIYDQIGGGFSRYSVDEKWHIPHFEKMLYDNAQLVSVYSKAYLNNQNKLSEQVVKETLNFIKNDLTAKQGAFYSSFDADSKNDLGEREEGAFYAWTKEQLKKLLGEDYSLFSAYYNINDFGFWEDDKYVLIRNQSNLDFAKNFNIDVQALENKVHNWKKILSKERNKRSKPNLDDKILTSWNALMIQGYVDAYKAFKDEDYLKSAIKNGKFLLQNQLRKDGGLNRNFKNGKSTINGYSEDYAAVIQSFISLYEVTFDEKWLIKSKELTDYLFTNFFDEKNKMFFFTSNLDDDLISKKTEVIDGVIPSSNSIIANCLFKLGHHFGDKKYTETSEMMLNNLKDEIVNNSMNYSNWLHLMTNFTQPFYEVAIVGKEANTINKKLTACYLPNILITGSTQESNQPLLENKFIDDETYVYVCVNGVCKLPETDIYKAIKTIKK